MRSTQARLVLALALATGFLLVTLAVGFTYMTATLIQLDLAARACPPEAAGTVFATLMALENLAASLGTWLGGSWYERGLARWGSRTSFHLLVLVGSACTAGCWLLVPFLPREEVSPPSTQGKDSPPSPPIRATPAPGAGWGATRPSAACTGWTDGRRLA